MKMRAQRAFSFAFNESKKTNALLDTACRITEFLLAQTFLFRPTKASSRFKNLSQTRGFID